MNNNPKDRGYRDEMYEAAVKLFYEKNLTDPDGIMEHDYINDHKEELCYCYEHHKTLIDFDWWCCYEDLLNVRISYEEYLALDRVFGGDPLDIASEDIQTITALQSILQTLRGELTEERKKQEPALEEKIQNAQEKLTQKATMSKNELYQALYDKFKESNKAFEIELSGMEWKEIKPYLEEYLLRNELLRVLEENLTSHELDSADCYALLHSTYSLGSIVEKFHELKHVEELAQEFRLDAVNAFEECANDRMEMICRMQKNSEKQVERV